VEAGAEGSPSSWRALWVSAGALLATLALIALILIITGSNGALIFVDPTTGAFQSQTAVGAGVSLSPVVANSTLYLFDDRGRLHAFR